LRIKKQEVRSQNSEDRGMAGTMEYSNDEMMGRTWLIALRSQSSLAVEVVQGVVSSNGRLVKMLKSLQSLRAR